LRPSTITSSARLSADSSRSRDVPGRHLVGHRLEAQHQALDALQQRVVQLARDALALAQPRLEPDAEALADLGDAKAIEQPEEDERQAEAQGEKPP
jgi:hypothetical protein